jgi:serine/threonine-protein kinase RsbW
MPITSAPYRVSVTVKAQTDSIARCAEFVLAYATAAGLSRARLPEMELVIEEVLVNICRHAYNDAPGEVEIRCVRADSEHLFVEFIDSGKPFNILASPAPDLNVDVNERQVGGLGIPLIRAMMDEISYCREGDRNILRFTARLPR